MRLEISETAAQHLLPLLEKEVDKMKQEGKCGLGNKKFQALGDLLIDLNERVFRC